MKTFGQKDPHLHYYTRPGAYLIAFEEDCVILVETPKGYFLPGGGLDADETLRTVYTENVWKNWAAQ